MATLIVGGWSTECSCGYGAGGWAASPALKGQPVLGPESTECPGCGEQFTETRHLYARLEDEDG